LTYTVTLTNLRKAGDVSSIGTNGRMLGYYADAILAHERMDLVRRRLKTNVREWPLVGTEQW